MVWHKSAPTRIKSGVKGHPSGAKSPSDDALLTSLYLAGPAHPWHSSVSPASPDPFAPTPPSSSAAPNEISAAAGENITVFTDKESQEGR